MKKKITLLLVLAFFLIGACTTQVETKTLKPTSSSAEAIDLFEKAKANIAANKDEEALELLNQVIELDEGFALAYIYRILVDGSLNSYRTNVDKALENLEAVSPDEQLFLQIFKLSDEKQGDQMKVHIDSIQKMFPEDVWTTYLLGTFNFTGLPEDGRSLLAKAIELDPNFIPAYIGLITDLTYLMELDEAQKYAEKYLEIRPEDADPYLKMGTISRQQNKLDKALKQYEKAAEIDPEGYLSNILLANCYVFMGNYEKGHELYQKSYELQKQSAYKRTILSNMAIARVFEGDKEKALEGFEKIHQYNIENGAMAASVYNRFSQAYASVILGDFDQADNYMLEAQNESESEELTDLQKENINQTFDLWTCYFECMKGNLEEATELVNKYRNVAKEQNIEWKMKIANLFDGIIAIQKTDYEKAAELLSNATEDYLSWYYLGLAYQELDQTEKAVELFSKITSANLINMNLANVKKDAVKRMGILSKN